MEGFVKAFYPERRFGFIASPGMPDIFFGDQDLDRELDRDDTLQNRRVQFITRMGPKGPIAFTIRPAN